MIEVLIVVTIIGLLAGVLISRMSGHVGSAREATAKIKIAELEQNVMIFESHTQRLPEEEEGLEALLFAPDDVEETWQGPYIKKKGLTDPWGRPFIYRNPGQENPDFDIFSLGKDGEESEDDIGNWE